MCEEFKPASSGLEDSKPTVKHCPAFLFVENYAKEHGEKTPHYKHCANYDPKKAVRELVGSDATENSK